MTKQEQANELINKLNQLGVVYTFRSVLEDYQITFSFAGDVLISKKIPMGTDFNGELISVAEVALKKMRNGYEM